MSAAPVVTIVIVAFHDPDALRRCLESLARSTFASFRIVVVDNSLDDSVFTECAARPDVDYVPAGGNTGFSRGCNLGIARALENGSTYTWLLNPDTEVDPECLEELVKAAEENPEAGAVGGCIRYLADPTQIWYGGGVLSRVLGVGKHLRETGGATRETGYITGCCLLIPNAVIREIGGLDERIFMYLDDAEFCLRILDSGRKLLYVPTARLAHAVGPGSNWRAYPDYYLYFSVRNRPLVARTAMYRLHLHVMAWAVGVVKMSMYAVSPGVPRRGKKLRALAWGCLDSVFARAREQRRFPSLFAARAA